MDVPVGDKHTCCNLSPCVRLPSHVVSLTWTATLTDLQGFLLSKVQQRRHPPKQQRGPKGRDPITNARVVISDLRVHHLRTRGTNVDANGNPLRVTEMRCYLGCGRDKTSEAIGVPAREPLSPFTKPPAATMLARPAGCQLRRSALVAPVRSTSAPPQGGLPFDALPPKRLVSMHATVSATPVTNNLKMCSLGIRSPCSRVMFAVIRARGHADARDCLQWGAKCKIWAF